MLFANYICKKSGDCLIFLLMLKMLVVPENIFLEKKAKKPCKLLSNLILYTGAVNTVTLAMIQEVATRSVALPRKSVLVFLRS